MAKPTLAKLRFLNAVNRLLQDMIERSDASNSAMADAIHMIVDRVQASETKKAAKALLLTVAALTALAFFDAQLWPAEAICPLLGH